VATKCDSACKIALHRPGDGLAPTTGKNGLTPTGLLMEGQCAH
jgi:hypothetical protein